MARFLRQSTSIIVAVGPFVSSSNGLTRLSALVLSATDRASIIKANTSAAALNISARTWSAIVSAEGHYALTVSATDADTVGALRVNIADDSECLPVYNDFYVLEEAIYDALFAASAAAFDSNQDVTVGAHAAGSFTSAAWAASAIISAAISAGAITSTGIADGAITSAEIAAGAIISATFAAGAINAAAIAADAITSSEIAAGAITSAKFAASAIVSSVISANALVQAHFSANAIASAALSADAVTKIQAGLALSSVLATVSTDVTSILDDTGTAGVVVGSFIASSIVQAAFSANAIASAAISADAVTKIQVGLALSSVLATVSGDVTSILGDTGTDGVVIAADAIKAANISADAVAEIQAGLATSAAVATIDDFLDTEISAILALLDDPRTEPGQGAPPVNPDLATKIDYLYKFARNRVTQTSAQFSIYADDATTVDHKAAVSDDSTTFDRGELATGP